jgi:hypothetical protein
MTPDRAGHSLKRTNLRLIRAGSAGKRGPHRGSPDGVLVLPAYAYGFVALTLTRALRRSVQARCLRSQH